MGKRSCHSPSLLSSSCTHGTHRGWSEEGGAEQQPSEPVTSAPYLAGSSEDVIYVLYDLITNKYTNHTNAHHFERKSLIGW